MKTASKALAYERAVPAELRTRQGLFYTPDAVADIVASGALALWRSAHEGEPFEGLTVLDPSCGAGALLAAASRALEPSNSRLVGRDIDRAAICLARERLGSDTDLQVGDALDDGPTGDIVLTNPPYGKDPVSEDLDRFVTFWRAALRRVRPGGVLAVLAPTAWQTGVRYASARREVIGASGVRRIVELPRGSFPDAYVDTCIALCVPHLAAHAPPALQHASGGQGAWVPASKSKAEEVEQLGALFLSRRGILAPRAHPDGAPLLLGPVVPFVWPGRRGAFARVRPRDVVEGRAALALDRGPRLLVRRIVGRASRLTCVVTSRRALVKKDFYILVPREEGLSLTAYSALLHAKPIAERLAANEVACTKDDFAQVTLARLRDLRVPRLVTPTPRDRARVRRLGDADVDARDAAAWLELWARKGEALGRVLSRERAHFVDADPRWDVLRARLDAFVERHLETRLTRLPGAGRGARAGQPRTEA
jgi:predicted RNA methylase